MSRRFHPNIIITGTPGCGKTSHTEGLVKQLGKPYQHFNISDIAKERECLESYDERLDTHVVDEDRLLDSLETDLRKGGILVDWHCCDIFPERLIDLVVVLRTDNSTLVDRLTKRNYSNVKIQENLDCEIMEVIVQDAREAYAPEIVIELQSNNVEEMDLNVDRINAWVDTWVKDHKEGVTNEIDPELLKQRETENSGSEGEQEEEEDDEDEDEEEDDDESFAEEDDEDSDENDDEEEYEE